MTKKLIIVLSVVIGFSLTAVAEDLLKEPPITGTYQVVTMRNASDVSSPATNPMEVDDTIGQEITFTDEGGLKMKGIGCDSWEILLTKVAVINTKDPMLADINVPPTDSPKSSGDQRIGKTWHYNCEGESFIHVYQVDDRVLVIPWKNGSRYLIVEKPLTEKQIKKLQAQLKDMKFHHFEPTGILDDETLQALSFWAQYRLEDLDAYRFKRTAITENLLDTMRILD